MRIALLAAAAVLLVGCVAAGDEQAGATPQVGTSEWTLDHDGHARTYRLYRPAALDEPAPLVVVLHGALGTGAQAQRAYGWDAMADATGFAVAYPDGVDRAWNTEGDCCGTPGRTGVDDVGFLAAMINEIGAAVPVDRDRIYLTGMSNGAMMSYTMACRTSVAAAIGPVAGTQLGDCADPAPTSVIHVHGSDDANVRYDGEPGIGIARIDGPPVPELHDFWRAVDDCAASESTTTGQVTVAAANCRDGRAVRLVTVAGTGHSWPGTRSGDPLDATAVIWEFFATRQR
ncbi:extracellular catalytic domain type 1 short-chain-length polyhydroxyalkanoate depolymerase [Nocardia rhizosphaerae]|uniref:Alpha/beta hydrolase family esterase n=1 Tax=Nocardia rhizosphaerae TaxID=1691571 RepID=A0ABV8L720_9NOCA